MPRSRDPVLGITAGRFNSNSVSLSVTQPLYRPQNIANYEQSKIQVAQADAVFAQAAQDLILRVAQAYFDVLLAQDTVEFAGAQMIAIGQQLEQAKRNFEVGTATITDTHDAQARYDLTVSGEIAARNDLELRKRAARAPHRAPRARIVSARRALQPGPTRPRQHGALGRGRGREQPAGSHQPGEPGILDQGDRAQSRRAPPDDRRLRDLLGFELRAPAFSGPVGSDNTSKVLGVQLAIPIYQGGLISSRVREAIANEDKARQDLENARRTAELTARQGFLSVTSGIAQVKALEGALVSSQSSLDSTRLGQEVGVRTQVDVLNAQQLLFQTRRDLAQSKYNYVLFLLRLKAAVGKLSEEDLARVNLWLDKIVRCQEP